MKSIIPGIVFAIVIFFVFQMILPFPYGIVLGIVFGGLLVWYTIKNTSLGKESLLNYRRLDPINEKEKNQNDEALRILEKNTLKKKFPRKNIWKEKEFEDIEYNPRKCKLCDSVEFEFVLDRRIKELGEPISDEGYYRCKKCGSK